MFEWLISWLWSILSFPPLFFLGLMQYIYSTFANFIGQSIVVELFPSLSSGYNIALLLIVALFVALATLFFLFRRVKHEVIDKPRLSRIGSRFRKRDKIRYYAVHFSRKFSALTEKLNRISSPEARQEMMVAFVRRLFGLPNEMSKIFLNRFRLPESFYEPDEDDDVSYPDDLKLMISSIRVFGHLEKSFFIDFCKFIETVNLNTGDHLFRVGEPDDNLYVVQSGCVQIYIIENDGTHSVINEVTRGGSIDSFLSVLYVLSGNTSVHEATEAIALEPSVVLKLPSRSFLEICQPQTPAFLRILQMITIRLQRLVTLAIQNHLGMSSELICMESSHTLTASKAQSCLQSLQLKQTHSPNSTDMPNDADRTIIAPESVFSRKRESLHPMDKEYMEMNEKGIIMDDFDLEPDHIERRVSHEVTRGGLECGEVPSFLVRDSCTYHSSAGVSTGASSPRNIRSRSLDPTQMGRPPCSTLEVVKQDQPASNSSVVEPCPDLNNEIKLVDAVIDDLVRLFNLPDGALLQGHIVIGSVPAETVLTDATDIQTELYYIISGELRGFQPATGPDAKEGETLLVGRPGDVLGLLGLVTGEPAGYVLKAHSVSILATLSREQFYAVVRQNPETLQTVIRILCARISPLLHQLDLAIQWLTVWAGKALYKKGDSSHFIYVVLSGRLRQVDSLPDGGHRIVGECGRGDVVGFLEVLCSQERLHTVIAIRDSEVAQIPALLLHYLKHKVPRVLNHIIQLLSGRLLGKMTTPESPVHQLGLGLPSRSLSSYIGYDALQPDPKADSGVPILNRATMSNLRTIAILPTSSSIRAEAFALELQHSLTPFGSSVRLTSHIIRQRLGPSALASVNRYRLTAWLSHQEDSHRIVFFVCDSTITSPWNRLCMRQADCVLVLASGDGDPLRISLVESYLRDHPSKMVKALVLMYPLSTDYPKPCQTAKWLNVRPWISHHYHIRCEPRVFAVCGHEDLITFYSNVFARERPNPQSDFSRLARYLTGEAIGLVLGGGGARGCAHIGVIRAFQEAGIPIDLVGGTSIGAFMSGLWAEETRYAQFTQRARAFTTCFGSIWNKLKDFTYPAVSVFSGKGFNEELKSVFKDRQVEDLWIPSFYVTTDITNCRMRVHTQGSLWRYVRASMSLSGYLPPLCDPYDGSLLLDGGYINNVPADVMSVFGAKTIFAVDVGATVDTDFTNYGDHLSGWQLLYNRLFGRSRPVVRVPNLSEIQARLAYISCVRQLEHIKASGICQYLRPPIDHYMTLQFGAFEEILSVGYEYAKHTLLGWYHNDLFKQLMPWLQPNMLFDQLSPRLSPLHTSHSRATDVSRTVSNWLTQPFDEQRSFVDLAETLGTSPGFRSTDSQSDSDSVEFFKDPDARRHSNIVDAFGRHFPPFLSRGANPVGSLSRTVRSYFDSAKHLVSRTLPNAVLFRRRALSENLCTPSDSSLLDSSDELGHFYDVYDYPGQENTLKSKRANVGYLARSDSYSGLSRQLNSSNDAGVISDMELTLSEPGFPARDFQPNIRRTNSSLNLSMDNGVVYTEDDKTNDHAMLRNSDPEFQTKLRNHHSDEFVDDHL